MERQKAVKKALDSILFEVDLSTHQAKVIWHHLNYLYVAGYESRFGYWKRILKLILRDENTKRGM